ncbi:tRNA (guanine-N(7)-)-methyltransferase subunit TRM82 [Sporothrix schenckii 1099-18]|uniref:tRNA (Guanine-N(7)-)-methyltransferase subunit TRM82 n=1 Tax=Sporothrix schenckii 1099-18 TaxID=1397361 RepID=A0A0F2M2R9_SPOSC|nr:tRNA (guanine-N(7)-)-methyltransferase subunit TRM82 [Sporothrix schenckii 1099-18]KJR83414.1 tRNA (guanine-N(7)-)-methyltransferase subunit TRM82 [Sporothrix schenckii 1099-18]
MAVPFHRLRVCGSILVAARGASIHTFNITDGSHIAAWRVPRSASKEEEKHEDEGVRPPEEDTGEIGGGDDVPPSKRRRLDETEAKDNTKSQEQQPQQTSANGNANANPKKKKSKSKSKQAPANSAKPQNILEATADGRHLVVMMGHDKTLRVLAHDLQGHLTQLSARVMPKRPSAVAFTADNQTILSGDKFGDVYALPLIEVEKTEAEVAAAERAAKKQEAAEQKAAQEAAQEAIVAPRRLEANKFTVHTKGNRQALENQRRQKELLIQQGLDPLKKDAEASASEYQLLLGHVSMLTAVAVGAGFREGERPTQGGPRIQHVRRPLILTADRDEHIRVTRGVVGPTAATSQTHVIETFCLGHTSFVSRLCIPSSRPDRLVSGGGDGELRVWNFWPEGRLVGTADLAAAVASVASVSGAEAKVALSGLYALGSGAGGPDAMTDDDAADAFLVAICERIPALFFFRLAADGATLAHTQTVQLPEGQLPLDVAEVGDGETRRLVVAAAPAEEDAVTATPLLSLMSTKEGWTVAETSPFAALPPPTVEHDPDSATLDHAVLRKLLLHSNESLRKDNENEE